MYLTVQSERAIGIDEVANAKNVILHYTLFRREVTFLHGQGLRTLKECNAPNYELRNELSNLLKK